MDGTEKAASRAAILARYHLIRASIQDVLRDAIRHCRKPDLDRAAKHLGLWEQAQLDDAAVLEDVTDLCVHQFWRDDCPARLPVRRF